MKKWIIFILLAVVLTGCATNKTNPPEPQQNNNNHEELEDAENEIIDRIMNLIETEKYEDAYKMIATLEKQENRDNWYSKFTVIENVLISQYGVCADDAIGNPGSTGYIYYNYNKEGQIINAVVDGDVIDTDQCTIAMKNVGIINYLLDYEEYTYNENGQLDTLIGYKDATKERKRYTAKFIYNDVGQKIKVEYMDNEGRTVDTFFTYDEQGKLTRINDTFFPVPNDLEIKYDENGLRIYEDAQAVYDELGRLVQLTYDNGTVITYQYGDVYVYEE